MDEGASLSPGPRTSRVWSGSKPTLDLLSPVGEQALLNPGMIKTHVLKLKLTQAVTTPRAGKRNLRF